jgi:oligopeptide transport system substrate-binding protein
MKALVLLPLLCCCSPQAAELTVANGPEIDSFDPQLATSAGAVRLLGAVFDRLTAIEAATGKLVPQLAESWTSSNQNRHWSFALRSDAVWSDGSPLTPSDVISSWKRLQEPSTAAPYADWLGGAQITSSGQRIDVVFSTPQPLFATYCSYHALAPIPPELRNSPPGTFPEDMRYSGKYKIISHRIRDCTKLAINELHADYSPDSFKTIDFLCVDSHWTALNLFLDEQVDFIGQVPQLAIEKLQNEYPDALTITPSFATYFIRLQQDSPSVFANKNLRKALSLAIDRKKLVQIIKGGRRPAYGLVPDGITDYLPPTNSISFSAETAESALQLALTELGVSALQLDYLYPASELNRAIAEFLQQQWKEVLGLEITLNQLEAKSFFVLQSKGDYQLSHSTWIGDYYHPFTFLELFQSGHRNNRSFFSNKQYDKLIATSQLSVNPTECLQLLSAAEQVLLNEYAIIPLCFDSNLQLLRQNILGHKANKFGIIEWHKLRKKQNDD